MKLEARQATAEDSALAFEITEEAMRSYVGDVGSVGASGAAASACAVVFAINALGRSR